MKMYIFTNVFVCSQQNGQPSGYIDPRYNPNPSQQFNPTAMAQQAQDPNHPAHPSNPNVNLLPPPLPPSFLLSSYPYRIINPPTQHQSHVENRFS